MRLDHLLSKEIRISVKRSIISVSQGEEIWSETWFHCSILRIAREENLHKGIYQRGNPKDKILTGGVAQLGEHLPCKQGVRSSILLISTIRG